MSTSASTPDDPPADLLEGAVVVEEISWPHVFQRICARVDHAVGKCAQFIQQVPCPDCLGPGCKMCRHTGRRPFRDVYHDPRARLDLAVDVLTHQLKTAHPRDAYWLRLARLELNKLLIQRRKESHPK